jgi:baculoviral IAP repeat-containing protein 6
LLQELVALEEDLPSTMPNIWLRYDEETPQYLRCLITAPQGTPYALGLFAFDIWIPDSYPSQPPHMQLLTTGGGTVRFSPNLYQNGKVRTNEDHLCMFYQQP